MKGNEHLKAGTNYVCLPAAGTRIHGVSLPINATFSLGKYTVTPSQHCHQFGASVYQYQTSEDASALLSLNAVSHSVMATVRAPAALAEALAAVRVHVIG